MIPPKQSPDEARRLEALQRYEALNTPSESDFDELAGLAAQICETPIALVSLVDETRQWFKARVGVDLAGTPREISFCGHALGATDLFVVPDALKDERFADNPLVIGEPNVRFYAGAPLRTPEGDVLGTLCVMDCVPRTLTPEQEQALRVLSRQVMTQFDLRRQTRGSAKNERLLRAIFDAEPECVKLLSADGRLQMMNYAGLQIIEAESFAQVAGHCVFPLISTEHRAQFEALTERVFRGESGVLEFQATGLKGTPRWLETHAAPLRDESGTITALLGITRDITGQKEAEQALRRSKADLQLSLDAARMGTWDWNIVTGEVAWSARCLAIYGIPPGIEMSYERFLQVVHPDDRTRTDGALRRAVEERGLYDEEKRVIWPDGSLHWTASRAQVFCDATGQPVRMAGVTFDITERKQAEEALRVAEEKFRCLVEQSIVGIYVIQDDRFAYVNPKMVEILGFSEEVMTSAPVLDFILEEDRPLVRENIQKRMEGTAGSVHYELRMLRHDGSVLHVEAHGDRAEYKGRPAILGSLLDISERKRAEEARRASEVRYRTLFDYAPDGILIADPEGTYIDANASVCRMLGYTREEFLGLDASDLVVAEEIEHIAKALSAIKAKSDYHREWKFRRKDGSVFPADVISTMMPDGNLLAMIRDITERKRTEARFRRLVDSNAQGVLFWNASGQVTGANDAFLRMVGYTREDLAVGRVNWARMTPPEYAPLDRHGLEEVAASGVCAPFEKEYLRKDGTSVPVLVGAANFEDSPEEGVCFVLDLTERKKLEQQFLRAQRMESIGTLAGGIAHDLNNALGPIIMSLDLLKMKFTDPGSQELLGIIGSSAQRGADMVRQVLSFARGVEGRRMDVQARHLIAEIEKIASDTFPKNIQVRTAVSRDLWSVVGDPTQLHQVLLNFCVNARDAMANGGRLTISAENRTLDEQYAGLNPEAKPGPYVFIQVEDSGTGIAPEIMGKIFDPFFTTKEVGKGTGLGLSTSLAIVKSHGGFVRVDSELEKGAKFCIHLPAKTEAAASVVAEVVEKPRGNGELILVIDDEASVRQITQQTLQAFGYHAITASDGAEGLAAYVRQRVDIDLVVTDMMMPVMDGPALIQVLQKINSKLPIIATSGLSTEEHAARATSLGAKQFLSKPYTAGTLLKAVMQVLRAREK
jgi:PAS domain S-box-containing protein